MITVGSRFEALRQSFSLSLAASLCRICQMKNDECVTFDIIPISIPVWDERFF